MIFDFSYFTIGRPNIFGIYLPHFLHTVWSNNDNDTLFWPFGSHLVWPPSLWICTLSHPPPPTSPKKMWQGYSEKFGTPYFLWFTFLRPIEIIPCNTIKICCWLVKELRPYKSTYTSIQVCKNLKRENCWVSDPAWLEGWWSNKLQRSQSLSPEDRMDGTRLSNRSWSWVEEAWNASSVKTSKTLHKSFKYCHWQDGW